MAPEGPGGGGSLPWPQLQPHCLSLHLGRAGVSGAPGPWAPQEGVLSGGGGGGGGSSGRRPGPSVCTGRAFKALVLLRTCTAALPRPAGSEGEMVRGTC